MSERGPKVPIQVDTVAVEIDALTEAKRQRLLNLIEGSGVVVLLVRFQKVAEDWDAVTDAFDRLLEELRSELSDPGEDKVGRDGGQNV